MPDPEVVDEGCFATTVERKYYELPGAFIKRSLRPREFVTTQRGTTHVPAFGTERLQNEAACLEFVAKYTDVPVPKVLAHFMDDGAYYLITERIDGVSMSELPEDRKALVRVELKGLLEKLKGLTLDTLGGPTGLVIPPYRVLERCKTTRWKLRQADSKEYVFCHNDLSQQNVMVEKESLQIIAIVDWEYAGFFPPRFEMPVYKRLGPSTAINGEMDDSLELFEFLQSREDTI